MTDHDPQCEDKDGPRYGQYCDCRLIGRVRSDERERIAGAIEADRDELTRRINDASDPYWSAEQANDWAIERVALNRAARIASRGSLRAGSADD